jgi:hypothetical protein
MSRTPRQATLATPAILQQAVILILRQGAPGNRRTVKGAEVEEVDPLATGNGPTTVPIPWVASARAGILVNADKAMVHVSKSLFESDAYKAVRRYDHQTREWLSRRALPSYLALQAQLGKNLR